MHTHTFRKRRLWSFSFLVLALAVLAQAGWQIKQLPAPRSNPHSSSAPSGLVSAAPASSNGKPAPNDGDSGFIVGQSYHNDISPALRTLRAEAPDPRRKIEEENENPPISPTGPIDQPDPVVQRTFGNGSRDIAAPLTSWNGVGSQGSGSGGCNCAPPDTNGEVGPNHYVQAVNTAFQIWDKTGGNLYGPTNINTLWTGFGGACQARNDGDPIVLYDQLADRWLISQFTSSAPYNECIAISTTGDPVGSWYRYAFQLSTTDFPDFPHLGVWPDGYYMTVNWFNHSSGYAGPRPYVFNRTQMLTGQQASFQSTAGPLGTSLGPLLPSDLDGSALPPAGAPDYVAEFGNPLNIYNFHVDWNTPSNTSFTNSASLATAAFSRLCATTRSCVPQPATAQKLDGVGDRLMHRLAYRNFGDHESIVATHSVNAGGGVAGVRWYEIRNPSTTATIYQQGTYSPDSTYRWMSSGAMNGNGDIALGYSAASSTIYPSIRYTGRLVSDPLDTMPQGEGILYAGAGSQSGVNRWGDYSAMTVDPTDDCTFWYTQEYNSSLNWFWQTRIGSFRLGSCGAGGPTPTPTPTNSPTPVPLTSEAYVIISP